MESTVSAIKKVMAAKREAVEAEQNVAITAASGGYVYADSMVSFFYTLARDHLLPGKVEDLVRDVLAEDDAEAHYCNGWLAEYATYVVKRLREKEESTVKKQLYLALRRLEAGGTISAADVIGAREALEELQWKP